MFPNKSTLGILSLGIVCIFTGCTEQSDKDLLAEAQYCIDQAAPSDASAVSSCLSKISSLSSPQAQALRCAGGFIGEGLTDPSKLSTAFDSISKGGGTSGLFANLAFKDTATASSVAQYCADSGQSGLALIGAMANSATILSSVGGCTAGGCNAAEIGAAIESIFADPSKVDDATLTSVATTVQVVYSSTCGGGNDTNSDICGPINSALTDAGITDVENATPSELVDLGKKLLAVWK